MKSAYCVPEVAHRTQTGKQTSTGSYDAQISKGCCGAKREVHTPKG